MTAATAPRTERTHASAHDGGPPGDRVPPVRHRNLTRTAIGVVVIGISILGVVSLTSSTTATRTVLVAARTVPAGEAISVDDLRTIRVPTSLTVPTIPADARARVVGRRALSLLTAGAPITDAQVGAVGTDSGTALVGTILKPGQYPTRLTVGDRVLIIPAPGPTGTDPGDGQTPVRGIVTTLDTTADGTHADGTTVLSLRVRATDAPAVAAAGGTGNLDLVVITP